MPEITHALMWVMSDRGIPRSLRTMQGFGVHPYRSVNARGGTGSLLQSLVTVTCSYSPSQIDDLMIDKHSGHVRYAVMEFGGFLGMGTDRFRSRGAC